MRVVRGQLSNDVLGVLVHTAEQRRADPVLVPQSNEAKAWRGGDDAASVIGIAFGSEHRELNPSEIRTEPGAPDNRTYVLEHTPVVEAPARSRRPAAGRSTPPQTNAHGHFPATRRFQKPSTR